MRILPTLVLAAAPAFAAAADAPPAGVAALWQGLSHARGVAADVAAANSSAPSANNIFMGFSFNFCDPGRHWRGRRGACV